VTDLRESAVIQDPPPARVVVVPPVECRAGRPSPRPVVIEDDLDVPDFLK
jgi:hypothetical protein